MDQILEELVNSGLRGIPKIMYEWKEELTIMYPTINERGEVIMLPQKFTYHFYSWSNTGGEEEYFKAKTK